MTQVPYDVICMQLWRSRGRKQAAAAYFHFDILCTISYIQCRVCLEAGENSKIDSSPEALLLSPRKKTAQRRKKMNKIVQQGQMWVSKLRRLY